MVIRTKWVNVINICRTHQYILLYVLVRIFFYLFSVDRNKYQIHIPLPPKIDPTVTMMQVRNWEGKGMAWIWTQLHSSQKVLKVLTDKKNVNACMYTEEIFQMRKFISFLLVRLSHRVILGSTACESRTPAVYSIFIKILTWCKSWFFFRVLGLLYWIEQLVFKSVWLYVVHFHPSHRWRKNLMLHTVMWVAVRSRLRNFEK